MAARNQPKTFGLYALKSALREEFRDRFLRRYHLRIVEGQGVCIDHEAVERLQALTRDDPLDELEITLQVHAGLDPDVPVLRVPFRMDEWLAFARRYRVVDLWQTAERLPGVGAVKPVPPLVRQDLQEIARLRAVSASGAALVEAIFMDEYRVPRERGVQARQGDAILAAIHQMGHSPTALPRRVNGCPGVKAEVRRLLEHDPLFVGDGRKPKLDRAWEVLRATGEIAEAGER